MNTFKLSAPVILLALLFACASPQSLSGGPKDETAPTIIENESTPNKQIQFREKEIRLTFNEWITLKDVDAQLVVSPLMPKKPEVKLKGKSVIITLPDSLAEETTYSLNFGNAIADLNEGNVLQNYSFIFSTGSFLDSIQLSGHVVDAVTLKPAEGVWVMLYPTGNDSVVYKQKPEYLARTSKEGKWSISNIRRDSFLVVALKDDNLNFLYDQETELFGWDDHNVVTDTSGVLPDIFVFPRVKKKVILEVRHPYPGWIKMGIPGVTQGETPEFMPALPRPIMEWTTDTLNIWYDRDLNYAGRAILGQDTTRVRASDSPIPKPKKFKLIALTGRMHPKELAKYKIGIPIAQIDTSLIELSKDTMRRIPFNISRDSLSPRVMNVKASWVPASRYAIKFLPGAITDIWSNASDSFTFSFVVNGLDQYSNLNMKVHGLDSTKQYLVLIKSGELIQKKFIIKDASASRLSSQGMAPGKYAIELIEDANQNGIWDTGHFETRQQPERKKIFMPDNLRAAWDVEVDLPWK